MIAEWKLNLFTLMFLCVNYGHIKLFLNNHKDIIVRVYMQIKMIK